MRRAKSQKNFQLLFDLEIEKTIKKNKEEARKKKTIGVRNRKKESSDGSTKSAHDKGLCNIRIISHLSRD